MAGPAGQPPFGLLVRVAYFDCFSGISGGMALAALVHAGADLDLIADSLRSLPLGPFELVREDVELQGIAALRIHVHAGPQAVIRTYASIRVMLAQADLAEEPRRIAERCYARLAEASARVHAKDVGLVTFHEFGAMDCMVDIVGCAVALHQLGVERVFASPIPTGLGMMRTEHGLMPVPGPIVTDLLRGAPTYTRGIPAELVTPTGAAILATVTEGYGEMPMMRADTIGYGAGEIRVDFPHVLRVVIGEEEPAGAAPGDVLVEGVVDRPVDWAVRDILDSLLDAGSRDAWAVQATGRAGEPRALLSALVPAPRLNRVIAAMVAGKAGAIRVSSPTPGRPD
jgi:uncharacterized protein (TIGR00299 family) protein